LRGREIADGNREERARAYHEAGIALRRIGACDRAVVLLDRAAECLPSRIEVIADGALARIDAGDYGGAAVCLERALGISGGERPAVVVSGRQAIEALLALVREACPHP
jgi:Tfp pilus assembly protein PilF